MKLASRKLIINTLSKLHLTGLARWSFILVRKIIGSDKTIRKRYWLSYQVKKLHIGCGNHILNGWLNTELVPKWKGVMRLDATKSPFPFEDSSFDYIFSEHMIEHISYYQGQQMLSECYRILKPGGKIRISTPDLQFFLTLWQQNKTELQKNFINYAVTTYIPHAKVYEETFILNAYVRLWGHQFIYDERVLRWSLEQIGFSTITKVQIGTSDEAELRGIENDKRAPPGIIEAQSMIFEATKPCV